MKTFSYLANLRRRNKIIVMMLTDFIILPLAYFTAIILREGTTDIDMSEYWWLLPCVPFLLIPIYFKLGLYRAVIRHVDLRLISTVFYGSFLGTLLIAFIVAMARIQTLPRTSLGIFLILSVAYVTASRLLAKGALQGVEIRAAKRRRVAIYGAGKAGTQIAYAMSGSKEFQPVIFLDDNLDYKHSSVLGLRVFAPQNLDFLIDKYNVDEILIAMPSLSKSRLKTIIESLDHLGVTIKILPGLADVFAGRVRVEQIREVQIEDLLGRDQVAPREELLQKCILGKNVCVTGAGGSIGSELCRQVVALNPQRIVLIEQNEFGLYEIEKELNALNARCEIIAILLDVKNKERVQSTLEKFKIQTVYHASAYKHVPLVELNPSVGILNNAFGTLSVAEASRAAKVENFILISTDKAVRPTNVMGASKRLAEMILQAFAQNSSTVFSMVRFGNVLGSSGSVVPLFREQIKKGGPVTITHKEITRYFMSIPEAAQLVIQAGSMASGGEVFLLDMGEPVKIIDLARKMIELSGLTVQDKENPDGDIAIEVTGLRPGEKLYEELLIGDNVMQTNHPRIMKSNEHMLEWAILSTMLSDLEELCHHEDQSAIKHLLKQIVCEYSPQI